MKDEPEAYIPLPPGRTLEQLIARRSPEEREAAQRWHEEHKARLAAEMAEHLARHEKLVGIHEQDRIIARLLHEHAPTTLEHEGRTYHICNTCGDDATSWPCSTWTTIDQGTPEPLTDTQIDDLLDMVDAEFRSLSSSERERLRRSVEQAQEAITGRPCNK